MFRKYRFFLYAFAVMFLSCKMTDNENNKSYVNKDDVKKLIEQNKYTLASYNVENLFDTVHDEGTNDIEFTPAGDKHWTQKRYDKKINDLSRILGGISDELPAIIGLCEVEHRSAVEDLANNHYLKKGNYSVVHVEGPDTRGIENALMFRSDLFRVTDFEAVPVIVPEAPESKLRDILYVKGYFFGGKVFHIFVNHWKSRREGLEDTEFKRVAAAKILREKCDEIFKADNDAAIVIMGDFNDVPESKSLKSVLRANNNTESPAFDEFYNLLYNKSLEGKGTNSRDYRWFMLDNLIVSQTLRTGKVFHAEEGRIYKPDDILYYNAKADFKTPNKTYGGKHYYGGYSDHLPVYFVLERIN